MPTKWIPYVKVLVHLICLVPAFQLMQMYRSGALGLMADPVNWITHFTGHYALLLLIIILAVTPVRRLHARLGNLIRLRRLLGLYAFFYATLHLGTYVFLFSGYDVPTVWAGLKGGHLGVVFDQWKLIWPTIVDDLKKRPYIQVGFFAWVILLLLAVTSPAVVMRAMGGKNWRRVHWSVYAAVLAGITHYWWLVKKGVLAPMPFTLTIVVLLAARVLWWAKERLGKRSSARAIAVGS